MLINSSYSKASVLRIKAKKIAVVCSLLALGTEASALSPKEYLAHGHAIMQFGAYWAGGAKEQHIDIATLIGDQFTVSSNSGSNGLVGLGYLIDGQEKDLFKMAYGVNAFYLGKTGVNGLVVQENMFANLSYGYQLSHLPVYAVAQSTIKTKSPAYSLVFDVGIGPNFMQTSSFHEESLGSNTLQDNIFSGRTTTTFSATTGLAFQLNHFFGQAPISCGYRFFYLGQGHFNKASDQVLTTLKTGSAYANAVTCGLKV